MAILLVGFICALSALSATLIAGHGWLWAIFAYVLGGMAGTLVSGAWIYFQGARSSREAAPQRMQPRKDHTA